MEHLEGSKLGLGCKLKNGKIVLDTKTLTEMQIALHITKATKVMLLFVNSNNLKDFIVETIPFDSNYFESKIEKKLKNFFENFLILQVLKQDITIKN